MAKFLASFGLRGLNTQRLLEWCVENYCRYSSRPLDLKRLQGVICGLDLDFVAIQGGGWKAAVKLAAHLAQCSERLLLAYRPDCSNETTAAFLRSQPCAAAWLLQEAYGRATPVGLVAVDNVAGTRPSAFQKEAARLLDLLCRYDVLVRSKAQNDSGGVMCKFIEGRVTKILLAIRKAHFMQEKQRAGSTAAFCLDGTVRLMQEFYVAHDGHAGGDVNLGAHGEQLSAQILGWLREAGNMLRQPFNLKAAKNEIARLGLSGLASRESQKKAAMSVLVAASGVQEATIRNRYKEMMRGGPMASLEDQMRYAEADVDGTCSAADARSYKHHVSALQVLIP